MQEIDAKIQAIIEKRRERVPKLRLDIEKWQSLDEEISGLDAVVHELRRHPRTLVELRDALAEIRVQELHEGIENAISLLKMLEKRFSRETVNIGVSGRARVGKSTLLQSISGLGDEQIPTDKGNPVTAVRSRIYHSATKRRAVLTLHTFETFSRDVLKPYHDHLLLPGAPHTLSEFETWAYPASEKDLAEERRDQHSSVTMLGRVRDMQQSLWSYKDDLRKGGERVVELEDLRPFVAYPKKEELNELEDKCPRRYLAVRDIRIECTFPRAQVSRLGVIDLPGLGELAPPAEKYHLTGLQNEVDVVLLVKRPVEGLAYWSEEDGKTANLLDEAKGQIKNRRDFVFLVVNCSDDDDPALIRNIKDSIRRLANDGQDGKHFHVLEADARSQDSVYERILLPVLEHLGERLPLMDEETLDGTRAHYRALASPVQNVLTDLESAIRRTTRFVPGSQEEVIRRAGALRRSIASSRDAPSLNKIVDELRTKARSEDEDPDYIQTVENTHEDMRAWIADGFGMKGGKDAWCKAAFESLGAEDYSGSFAGDEINRIRVEISNRFAKLDAYFAAKLEDMWAAVGNVLGDHLGDLLNGLHGVEALRRLKDLLRDAAEPCPTLSDAISDLLELRLEYRTHLHPRVRKELDCLNLEIVDQTTGEVRNQALVDAKKSDRGENLFNVIRQLAEQAAYETKKALVRDALAPALVLHAGAEQFVDTFIRSGDSKREFQRLARSYRDEIWPGDFSGLDEANARFANVAKAIRSVRELIREFE
jgi:hypothetical protein